MAEEGDGATFLELLRHVVADQVVMAHGRGAFDEAPRLATAVKALRLVCKEARRIVDSRVSRLRVEAGPELEAAVAAATQRFAHLDCLSVEVYVDLTQRFVGPRAVAARRAAAAASRGCQAGEAHKAAAKTAAAEVAAAAGLTKRIDGPALARSSGFWRNLLAKAVALLRRRCLPATPLAAGSSQCLQGSSAAAGASPASRASLGCSTPAPDPGDVQPRLARLTAALSNPAFCSSLHSLKYLSIQACPYGAERAPVSEVASLASILHALPSLRQLRLMMAAASPEALAPLAVHPRLKHLQLFNCDLSQGIGPLTNLTRLDAGMESRAGSAPQRLHSCAPDLSPLTSLQELRGLGWVLDHKALGQISLMPHLTYLEALRFSDDITSPFPVSSPVSSTTTTTITTAAATTTTATTTANPLNLSTSGLPAAPPCLRELRLTSPHLAAGTVSAVAAWCGRSLRVWHALSLNVGPALRHWDRPAVVYELGTLATLLGGGCSAPMLQLSSAGGGASSGSGGAASGQQGSTTAGCTAHLLSAALPTQAQRQQVQRLSLQGLTLDGADATVLLQACSGCTSLQLRRCNMDRTAAVTLYSLACPELELWGCSGFGGADMLEVLLLLGLGGEGQGRRLRRLHLRAMGLTETEQAALKAAADGVLSLEITQC